ncbi:MAG: hypothetical protein ABWZ66_13895 [Pyrinomonadaceae bacterium]
MFLVDGEKPKIPDSSKSYELSFEYRPQYLYVHVAGDRDSYEISKQYWREIAEECKRSACKKVLIEEDITENVSMPDMYQFASEILELGFFGIRVAFVDLQDDQTQLNKFGETVATNRGLFSRVFNNTPEAEKWLLSE